MSTEGKDRRPYFVMANEYPRHRKIRGLSDKAFRLHVTLLAICNEDRNDGMIGKHDLDMLGPKPGKELLDAGLVFKVDSGEFQLHDYLRHQNSRAEIEELTSQNKEAGAKGGTVSAHKRWHVDRGIANPNCHLCQAETG